VTPFAAIVGGGAAGLFGAALAHVLSTFVNMSGGEDLLRGPYGPPFFILAVYTSVFYGMIGAASGRKLSTTATGFVGPLLGIAGIMMALTRYPGWGSPRGLGGTPQWQLAVAVVYIAAVWGTIALLGALSSETSWWRGALAAVAGSLAGYGILSFLLWAVPSYSKVPQLRISYLPSPVNLMDGLLSGAGLCLALSLDAKFRRNPA